MNIILFEIEKNHKFSNKVTFYLYYYFELSNNKTILHRQPWRNPASRPFRLPRFAILDGKFLIELLVPTWLQQSDMFRSGLARTASFARNLAVPNNCKCIGKIISHKICFQNVANKSFCWCSLQPAYALCRSTPPSRTLNLMPVMNPSSTAKISTVGSAERFICFNLP